MKIAVGVLVGATVAFALSVVVVSSTHQEQAAPLMASEAAVTTMTLRCAQSPQDGPVSWIREDAEAMVHYANEALETAQHHSGSPALKQAFATEALAALRMVELCWDGR